MAPPCPPPSPSLEYREEVPSNSHNLALPRSDAIDTPFGVITPESVYNLPPAFWPASLKDKVKNLGIDVGETNRADPSSSVPHETFEELLENLDFSTLSPHANVDIFEILGLSVDAYNEQNEIDAVIKQEEDEDKFWLTPNVITNHNNGAAAFDSEELLSYITGSRKRKRAVSSDNDCFSSANESFAMFDDFELFESPRAKPRLDSN
ncbi:hypothetical protein M9458_014106, partial [Cirrhinus mrigala]